VLQILLLPVDGAGIDYRSDKGLKHLKTAQITFPGQGQGTDYPDCTAFMSLKL